MKYIILALCFTSVPFFLIVLGFLHTLKLRGTEGVKARLDIGVAMDMLAGSCLLFPLRKTISGHVGSRVANGGGWKWELYEWLIDSLPWFYRGHCLDAAEKESRI